MHYNNEVIPRNDSHDLTDRDYKFTTLEDPSTETM